MEGGGGKMLQLAYKCIVAKKKSIRVPLLTAGYNRANKPWILLTVSEGSKSNPIQFGLLVYSEDDLAQSWQSNSFQALSVGFFKFFFFYTSPCCEVNKEYKNILQLNVSETKWFKISIFSKSLMSEIHTVRQSCPTECPHLGQSATNVSLNFEM